MENLITLIGITAIVVVNALIAYVLGWLFTEVVHLPLNFKPFNCRPCLAFWFTVLLNCVFALLAAWRMDAVATPIAAIYGISGAGVLCGLIIFLYVKLKFKTHE